MQWHADVVAENYFAAAFKNQADASKCFNDADSIGYGAKRYTLPATKKCGIVSAYPHECECATEIPNSVHIVIVRKNIQSVYRVYAFETLDSAKQYARLANRFGLPVAIFANAPVRDSYEGLDCSYEKVEVSKKHDSPIEEIATSKKVSSMENSVC